MLADQVKKLIVGIVRDYYGECELIEHPAGTFHSRYQLTSEDLNNSLAFGNSLREMYYRSRSIARGTLRRLNQPHGKEE
jgi:hypothetical protein